MHVVYLFLLLFLFVFMMIFVSVKLENLFSDERCLYIRLLTLYFWILGHKQKCPSQCSCCCISSSSKEIKDGIQKVFIVEVAVGNPRFLHVQMKQSSY